MESVQKIQFKYFVHEKGKMTGNISGEFLYGKKSDNIDEAGNKRK